MGNAFLVDVGWNDCVWRVMWRWTGGGEVVIPPWYWVKQGWRRRVNSRGGICGGLTLFDPGIFMGVGLDCMLGQKGGLG